MADSPGLWGGLSPTSNPLGASVGWPGSLSEGLVLISPVRAGAELVFLELWCPQESLTWWGELQFQGHLLEVWDGAQKPAFLTCIPR